MTEITPMMRQYYKIKEKYKDAILLFRVGDFYETFGEDAKIASKELNIVLTSTGKKGKKIPMAGVPFHAASTYINQLIKKGYKVAICEQVEEKGRGLVKREVVRLITPGTIIEPALLEERSSNYLMCVNIIGDKNRKVGVAIVDISTGEFSLTEFEDDDSHSHLLNEIARLKPMEIVIPESLSLNFDKEQEISMGIEDIERSITRYDDFYFDYENAYTTLINHFRVISLDGFGCSGLRAGIGAAGAAISYLRDTQKRVLTHINSLKTFFISDYMILDGVTLRNLEIFKNIRDGTQRGTLISILDETKTPMGSRLLNKNLKFPLLDVTEIKKRQEAVKELYEDMMLRESIKEVLEEIYDIERIIGRVSYGSANARDLVTLKKSLKEAYRLKDILKGCKAERIKNISRELRDFSHIIDLIERGIVEEPPATVKEGGIIKEGFNEELDELRRIKHEGREWLAEFEEREKRKTGIKTLKVGYNKVFGYYIEVTKSYLKKVPPHYIRKQTLTEAERYITEELKEYEAKALSAEERIKELEYELFEQIRKEVNKRAKDIQEVAGAIAELDMLLAFAEVAASNGYCCPEVNEGYDIVIKEGRHPVVEREVKEGFVPNDTYLGKNNRLMIITGPNMSGKSTYMRQVALIVIMAQIGSFVPAKEAKIGVVDRIFTRVGAYDDLSMGQSSFMVEMSETANILNNATERSLIILDEIGRGTSTFDGVSIAWAVASYIHDNIKAKTMFATHFYELTGLADCLEGAKCYNVSIKEAGDEIFFIRKVVEGKGSKSYGIQVAKLAGLPEEVIESAKGILRGLEGEKEKEGTKKGEEKEVIVKKVVQTHPVIEELKKVDVEKISPIEALNLLYEMKKKLQNL
ncbi:MAG: DNA mismatch repair protein MutS [Candidatus Methanospirareceae archaeon]